MYPTTESLFYQYINSKKCKYVQGEMFHSNYYVDEDGNYIGYVESSSWNMHVIYKTDIDMTNSITADFVSNMIFQKTKL